MTFFCRSFFDLAFTKRLYCFAALSDGKAHIPILLLIINRKAFVEPKPNMTTKRDLLLFLNRLRVHSLKKHTATLSLGGVKHKISLLALQEANKRDVTESKVIFFQSEKVLDCVGETVADLEVPFDIGSLLMPLVTITHLGSDLYQTLFVSVKMRLLNRRYFNRYNEPHADFGPVHVKNSIKHLSFQSIAKIVDTDPNTISIQMISDKRVNIGDLESAEIRLMDTHFCSQAEPMPVIKVYEQKMYRSQLGDTSAIKVVLKKHSPATEVRVSILPENRKHKTMQTTLSCINLDIAELTIDVADAYVDGFRANLSEPLEAHLFPEQFAARIDGIDVLFLCTLDRTLKEPGLNAIIIGNALGDKVSWTNFVASSFLDIETSFQHNTVEKMLDLMVMNGLQSSNLIASTLPLQEATNRGFRTESPYSRTKLRWIKRDENGALEAHYQNIRTSNRLWMIVDNMSSPNFRGSWMKDYICDLVFIFGELTKAKRKPEWMILLGFNPQAGVWNNFDEMVRSNPELTYSRNRNWYTYLNEELPPYLPASNLFSFKELSHPNNSESHWIDLLSKNYQEYLLALSDGSELESNSDFRSDYIQDYGHNLRQYFYLVEHQGSPAFILTFFNIPNWPGINGGHNKAVLFDLGTLKNISEDAETHLFSGIQQKMASHRVSPKCLGIISETLKTKRGTEIIELLLKPAGYLKSTEGFRGV